MHPSATIRAMEEIGLKKLRSDLAETFDRVEAGDVLVVTNVNRYKAVLLSVAEYERLLGGVDERLAEAC